jgi:hypothetical protein
MPPQIAEHLSRISSSSSQLNQLTKDATDQIRALDEFLTKLDIGISCTHDQIDSGKEENRRGHMVAAYYSLAYGRDDDGKFGLVIEAYAEVTDTEGVTVIDPDPGNAAGYPLWDRVWTQRLQAARRELRIAAVKHLPELLRKLAEKIEATKTQLQRDMEATKTVTEELKAALDSATPKKAKPAVILGGMPPISHYGQ